MKDLLLRLVTMAASPVKATSRYVGKLVEENKLVRRLTLLWSLIVVSWVTVVVFTNPPNISAGTATAYGVAVGILGSIIALYKYGRDKEDERKERRLNDIKKEEGDG